MKKSDSIEQYLNSVLANRNIWKIIELNVNEIIINTQDSVREFNCYAVTRVSVYVCLQRSCATAYKYFSRFSYFSN